MMLRRLLWLPLAGLLLTTVASAQQESAEAETPDWATYVFPWSQPDAKGDEATLPTYYVSIPWADIREMAATSLPDGRLFFKVRVEEFSCAYADWVYSVFFAVDGKPYQASYYTRFTRLHPAAECNSQPGPSSRSVVWQECGTVANTAYGPGCGKDAFKAGTWLMANETVIIEANVNAIEGLGPGTEITGISFRTYEWYGLSSQGPGILRDRADPTVEPLAFTYDPPGESAPPPREPGPSATRAASPAPTPSGPSSAPPSRPVEGSKDPRGEAASVTVDAGGRAVSVSPMVLIAALVAIVAGLRLSAGTNGTRHTLMRWNPTPVYRNTLSNAGYRIDAGTVDGPVSDHDGEAAVGAPRAGGESKRRAPDLGRRWFCANARVSSRHVKTNRQGRVKPPEAITNPVPP